MRRLAAVAVTALVAAGAASAAGQPFEYERPLVTHGKGPFTLVPDARLTGHARSGFDDLRVVDRHGAPVAWRFMPGPPLRQRAWPVRTVRRSERGKRTVVLVDLGFALPATAVRVSAQTAAYDRPVLVEESLDGTRFWDASQGRLRRVPGSRIRPLPVEGAGTQRYVRVTIANGDDRALRGIRVDVLHAPTRLLVAGGGAPPYRLRYGAPRLHAPDYDFARLPLKALGISHATPARLGEELTTLDLPRGVKILAPKPSIGSYHWLVIAGLGAAAIVVGAAGFLVVRRKTPS